MDSRTQFTKTTVFLHWIIALAIIGSLIFGMYLEDLPRSPDKGALVGIHKSIGVLILLVALYRIYWRIRNGFPQRLTPVEQWQEKVATIVHLTLLAGTVLMPISGILMTVGNGYPVAVFGLNLIPGGDKIELLADAGHIVHGLGAKVMIAAVLLHVAAAVKLQLSTKDGSLARMFGRKVS
ncbi:cytochrome b [Amphritea sp.]|uniref:cytochrome b n=1 Tax=Amphritea sp. TaxID=1872502 RepID=UPI003A8E2690